MIATDPYGYEAPDPFLYAADILEKGAVTTFEEFIYNKLGESIYAKQREVIRSVEQNRRTAVKSCHDAGKSYLASRAAAYWLDSHPIGEAFVVSTAPSDDQVRGVLWREIGKAHRKGHLIGRVNQKEWYINDELVGFGRKPQDQDPGAFQGIHAKYVLVIIDEACYVPKDLWLAAGSLAANEYSRILAIGNPDDPGSHFAEICKPGSGWNVIRISYTDTPNFSGEDVDPEIKPLFISSFYVEEMRRDVGESGAPFISKCLGEFPKDSEDGVVSLVSMMKCMQPEQFHPTSSLIPVELGWDVGAGGDKSAVRERRGMKVGRSWYPRGGADTMVQVDHVVEIINMTKARSIKVDAIGVGHGAADRLDQLRREGKHKANVIRVKVSEASMKPEKFRRLRDEIWWTIGHDLINDGGIDLHGLDDVTQAQLLAPKYALDAAGRINVEPKEETRARIGRSPDDADALLLAFYADKGQGHAFAEMWKRKAAASKAEDAVEVAPASVPEPLRRLLGNRRREQPSVLSPRRLRGNACEHRWNPRTGLCVFCQSPKPAQSPVADRE